jgi:hypothetical protein
LITITVRVAELEDEILRVLSGKQGMWLNEFTLITAISLNLLLQGDEENRYTFSINSLFEALNNLVGVTIDKLAAVSGNSYRLP